jgi:hypothetical protein
LGNIYLTTGNGSWDGLMDFGMSAVKLSPGSGGKLRVSSFFTPWSYLELNSDDMDFGSSGIMLIPGTKLIVSDDKEGKLYVMNAENLGGFSKGGPDKIVQELQVTFPSGQAIKRARVRSATGHIHGSPVYYDAGMHKYIYVWGENDFLHVFELNTNAISSPFSTTPVASSTVRAPQLYTGMPGGFLSISSNGNSTGIVWALAPYACNANQRVEPGILYAFDASNFPGSGTPDRLVQLWDSRKNRARDDVGYFAKFTNPTIANGKVYVVSWGAVPGDVPECSTSSVPGNEGQLVVYGLLPEDH